LADELGIELLFLPSYSPNLNLIERPCKYKEELASLLTLRFQTFAKAQFLAA
jgi:transposase